MRDAGVLLGAVVLAGALTGCGAVQSIVDRSVPEELRSYFVVAARRCPDVLSAPGLAAQAYVESKFRADAVSEAGAQGLMQVIPSTFAMYGVDADGDGVADPYTAADSVATAAKYSCALAELVRDVPGDPTQLRLAAYSAGPGAVQKHGGIPPYGETQAYVKSVQRWTERFADDFAEQGA